MNYKTYQPNSVVAPFVKCYWTFEAPKESEVKRQRIVPDGCMEMIFHSGDLFNQYLSNGSSILQPRCFVFGQITQALDIEPTGETGIFAVRFSPEGFVPFATLSISSMKNRAVSLAELFGEEGLILERDVLTSQSVSDKIRIVETFLFKKLTSSELIDNIARSCVELIYQLKGQLSVDELSGHMNLNRRQLERKFSALIGLSPKQLFKIIRLQSTLKLLANNQFTSLTSLAHQGDYYDQAHFIKDFKEFTGISPRQFFSDNLKMTALFLGSD